MKKLSKLILILFFLIFICEVLIRFFLGTNLITYSSLPYQPDQIIGYRYIPNARGTFINKAVNRSFSINNLGFPGENFTIRKADGTYRIIVVGQSDETGLNTNGPSNYISLLNDKFRGENLNVEVLNFSIDGGSRGVQNIKLADECKRFKPDLILLKREFPLFNNEMLRSTYKGIVMAYQESDYDSVRNFVETRLVNREFRLHLLDYSYIYRLLSKLYKKYTKEHPKENGFLVTLGRPFFIINKSYGAYIEKKITWSSKKNKYKPNKLSEKESLKILSEFSAELEKQKIGFIIYDTYGNKSDIEFSKLFSKNNICYLPLNVTFLPEFSLGKDDGHSSQKGHQAIAKILYPILREKAIINRED